MDYSFRQYLGGLLLDVPRLLWSIRSSSEAPWVGMRNRDERLIREPHGLGVRCDWQWTSDLHIGKVFPLLGRLLLRRALRDWPIGFQPQQERQTQSIKVSFIIGHRGVHRLDHLLLTLRNIAAQRDVSFECIVVEQSNIPEAEKYLPVWVRYVHTPLPYPDMPYCRSWAFNVGARMACGEVLILHDSDMLVPRSYAKQVALIYEEGFEVINLKRFIFFLTAAHTRELFTEQTPLTSTAPEVIMQNAEGGGSLAVSRGTYFAVGGFDESFVGWGGEDNEFWQRAETRRVWHYGYLPLVHLWHPSQPGKQEVERATATLFDARTAISAGDRIAELTSRDFGNPQWSSLPLSVHRIQSL